MNGYLALSYLDVALAALFVLLTAAISLAARLGLERRLVLVSLRMVAQLLLVGLLLKTLFALSSPWLTLLAALFMLAMASREVRARQQRPLAGFWGYGLGAATMMTAGMLITVVALTVQIRPDPWWAPRYALPLFGMILGNTMNGVALALDGLHVALVRERVAVEARLLLGHSRFRAVQPVLVRALRAGFTPILNAMAATGVISLPGMMTGQILAGVDPREAVKYQLLIMFLISGATGLGVLASVWGSLLYLTDRRDRLRLERLAPTRGRL